MTYDYRAPNLHNILKTDQNCYQIVDAVKSFGKKKKNLVKKCMAFGYGFPILIPSLALIMEYLMKQVKDFSLEELWLYHCDFMTVLNLFAPVAISSWVLYHPFAVDAQDAMLVRRVMDSLWDFQFSGQFFIYNYQFVN